ncbi:MAG: peptide transporter, partial [Muribaculaceae bacterium]|nr:peptide transporter [Muribaculaceae bacterium]
VGGAIAYFVGNSSKDTALNDARRDRGTLIASGLIAGGALFGVFAAITRFCGFEYETPGSLELTQILGCVAYLLLIAYFIWDSNRAKLKS